jgi:uncharacterized protein YyaL (SSP411 family)
MISALARADQLIGQFGERTYVEAATTAAKFVERELYDADGDVLYRTWRHGRGAEAFAEDYAFFVHALLDLYEATFEWRWLAMAERLQATMDARFWDEARGGYFNSPAGDHAIVLRLKEDYDGAEPAPSSVAAMNLLRLDAMIGGGTNRGWRERAHRCIDAFRATERAGFSDIGFGCA